MTLTRVTTRTRLVLRVVLSTESETKRKVGEACVRERVRAQVS